MPLSNQFSVQIRSQSVLSEYSSALTSGWSAPLPIPSLAKKTSRIYPNPQTGGDSVFDPVVAYPDTATVLSDTTGAIQEKRLWHWQSKWCWDPVKRRVLAIHSTHIETDNLNGTYLTVYDEDTNQFIVYQNPIMRTVGHGFDTNGIDLVNRRLYKFTVPRYVSGPAGSTVRPYIDPFLYITETVPQGANGLYVQPQLCAISLDAVGTIRSTGETGAALVQEISAPPRSVADGGANITAPGCDVFPGLGFFLYHDVDLWLYRFSTGAWELIQRPVPTNKNNTAVALHCIGHYSPGASAFIYGGGSYIDTGVRNLAFSKVNGSLVSTRLDDSPVCMSVNSAEDSKKCCATYIPGTGKSVFFHNNGNVYILDPSASPGAQWTTWGAMDADNASNNDRWCCPLPDHGCVMVGHFAFNGESKVRLWKP